MLFENEIARVGYLSRSVPVGIDLKAEILKMKNETCMKCLYHERRRPGCEDRKSS
jgi:hypothetical protein